MRSFGLWALAVAWCNLAACAGIIGDSDEEVEARLARPDLEGGLPPPAACGDFDVPQNALSHLTRSQYNNTVRDLLGVASQPANEFSGDQLTDGFEAGLNVSPLLVEQYFAAAADMATEVTADLDGLLACDRSTRGDDVCARQFLESFLPRAHRRPVPTEEVERYFELYAAGTAEQGFDAGIEMAVHAALASAPFLYREERPPNNATANSLVLAPSTVIANRLSYLLWNTMPDAELLDAASAEALNTREAVAEQARRMLEDERAVAGMRNFYRQWLEVGRLDGLEKDPTVFPAFNAQMASDMRASFEAYLDRAIWEEDGTFDTLFLGNFAYVNESLAPVYGVSGITGAEMQPVQLDETERAGLLTYPPLLAVLSHPNQSTPVFRGLFIRSALLCQELPPPPNDIEFDLGEAEPGLSTRERFAAHSEDPACSGCHQLMDPLGFGLENYDAIGQYRAEDQGVPVDARGEVFSTADIDGPFDGARELAERLASSEQVKECVATQLFRYGMGRIERSSEECIVEDLYDTARTSGWSIPETMLAVTQSYSFLHLRIPEDS